MLVELCPKCGSELIDLVLTSYPPIYVKQCNNPNCDFKYSERDTIEYVTFNSDNIINVVDNL